MLDGTGRPIFTGTSYARFAGDDRLQSMIGFFEPVAGLSQGGSVSPYEVAARYVRLIQHGHEDEIALLWAEEGVFCDPSGRVRRGRREISDFYTQTIRKIRPVVRMSRFATESSLLACVFELETRMSRDEEGQWKSDPEGEFVRSAVDWMTVDGQSHIQAMTVYTAPPSRWAPTAS